MAVLSERLGSMLTATNALSLLGASLAFLFAWSVVSTLRQYYRLRHIKGPPTTGFSKWWLVKHVTGGRTHLDLYDVTQKYGDIARIGPNDLVTSDPDLLRHMFSVRSQYRRGYWYHAMRLDPGKDNVFSLRDEVQHNKLRAKMAHGYSGKEVENLESTIDKNVLALMKLIQGYVSKNETFDLARKVQYFTMDVISDLAFGDPIGFVAADEDLYDYVKTMEDQTPNIIFVSVYPWLLDLMQLPIIKRAVPTDKDPLGFGKIMGLARAVAAERYAPDAKKQKDMVGSFMAHGLTHAEAESEILLQILAGAETTATAIRSTMLHLITNPRAMSALVAEISETLGTWTPDSPVVSDAQSRTMPYTQAVIKEGLRIFPPIAGIMPKEVPAGGDTWKGVHLPAGTEIGYCAWGVMRRADVWGDDAAEFRPERWLEASPEKLQRMESVLELTFSYGRWQCLGKNVAMMELNKVFIELLRRFDFTIVDPTKPWVCINVSMFLQSQLNVRGYSRT